MSIARKIINTVESDVEGEEESWKGFMWCGLLLITATAQITVSNHYFRFGMGVITFKNFAQAIICGRLPNANSYCKCNLQKDSDHIQQVCLIIMNRIDIDNVSVRAASSQQERSQT